MGGWHPLTERDIELLIELEAACVDMADHPRFKGWVKPHHLGGSSRSYHWRGLRKLVKHEYASTTGGWPDQPGAGRAYKITDLGKIYLKQMRFRQTFTAQHGHGPVFWNDPHSSAVHQDR